jgi:hypothetical protein
VSNIRTLYPTPNRTSKLLRRVDARVSAQPRPDVQQQFLSHATFFSSGHIIESLRDRNQLAQPALFRHIAWTLTGMQALIPTAIPVANSSVTMRWSENRVLYISTLMLYVIGF